MKYLMRMKMSLRLEDLEILRAVLEAMLETHQRKVSFRLSFLIYLIFLLALH